MLFEENPLKANQLANQKRIAFGSHKYVVKEFA